MIVTFKSLYIYLYIQCRSDRVSCVHIRHVQMVLVWLCHDQLLYHHDGFTEFFTKLINNENIQQVIHGSSQSINYWVSHLMASSWKLQKIPLDIPYICHQELTTIMPVRITQGQVYWHSPSIITLDVIYTLLPRINAYSV